jgi:quercetin dioxygenase-like cupin family protein
MTGKASNPPDDGMARVICDDLDATLARYVNELGYAVDEVFPADAPRLVIVSRGDDRIRLESERAPPETFDLGPRPIVTSADAGAWTRGRAGMEYRDLVPGRCGGRLIASHIRIPNGGPVPDYVHFHHVVFQLIFCVRGWVRVVYEDQGPPFVMEAGDCVLQPPRIRHRVLECSDGLEVVELSAPSEHRTIADRRVELPTATLDPGRVFNGQRFVRHRVAGASWQPVTVPGWEASDTGIAAATGGLGSVSVLRASARAGGLPIGADDGLSFHFVLRGAATLAGNAASDRHLGAGASVLAAPSRWGELRADGTGCELLHVLLSGADRPTATPAWRRRRS